MTNCTHESTHVSRQRGTRVRRKCDDCGHLGKWEKKNGVALHPPMPINPKVSIKGKPGAPIKGEDEDPNDYAGKTVAQLREACKANGVTGYSKMTKPELLEALGVPA